MEQGRIILTCKDVMRITGKSQRQSQAIITQIKKQLDKQRHQPVTIGEFCNYLNIDRQEVGSLD